MKIALHCAVLAAVCAGCTSLSLERHTVNQVATLADCRFQQVLDNLAATAANRGNLPAYAPIGDGLTTVSDTFTFDAKTIWQRSMFKGFSAETLSLMATFSPQPQWTVNPVVQREMLGALQAAMNWVVNEPPPAESDEKDLLDYFQVTHDLQALPKGWLGVGGEHDVPHDALYRAHRNGHWVWVTPAGMEGLSGFTLIIQDIATVDFNSLKDELPTLALKIKYGIAKDGKDSQDLPTIEATVKKDVKALIKPPEGKLHRRNWIAEIIGSAPSGLGLKQKNERFILPIDFDLATSQPPSMETAQPTRRPSYVPSYQSWQQQQMR